MADLIKIRDKEKFEHAQLLFMNSIAQKEIAQKVGVTQATLSKWVESFGWREKRAAKTVTRDELVNKLLRRIDALLEDPEAKGIDDALAKLSKTIGALDKQVNIVQVTGTFIAFASWLDSRNDLRTFVIEALAAEMENKDVYTAFIKTVNKVQDMFVNERLGARGV